MIYLGEVEINIMAIDATFWVAVSFVIFFGGLIYLKIPQKITEMLDKMISDIKNEIDESEKLRTEARTLLDNAQNRLDTAQTVSNEILNEAKKDSDKFHKSSEIKKNLAENKISQMKEAAIKEIKDASIKIAVDSVKKIITTSVDKSKLDAVFQKNLNETKEELKKINS